MKNEKWYNRGIYKEEMIIIYTLHTKATKRGILNNDKQPII